MARGHVIAGQPAEAMAHWQTAAAVLANAEKKRPGEVVWLQWKKDLEKYRARILAKQGDRAGATTAYLSWIGMLRELEKKQTLSDFSREQLRFAYTELAGFYAGGVQWDEAIAAMRTALGFLEQGVATRPIRPAEEKLRTEGLAKIAGWKEKAGKTD